MSTKEEQPTEQLNKDIELLNKLLAVEARKPGSAALLPAAIRVIEELEPSGGKSVPVFPASYAGPNDQSPPVYDLAGIEYGDVEETVRVKNNQTARVRQIVRALFCAIDSPQSQANRMEPAFLESDDLCELVPQANAIIPRRQEGTTSVLQLPHRVADFRIRLSDQAESVSNAIASFSAGDALPLIRLFPTSLLFGFWNSRGEEDQGIKHARMLLSRIDANDVVPCRRHSLYSGPYSKDEFAEAVLEREITKDEADKLSKEGFSAAPSDGLGGVLVRGKIERLSLLSLTDLARINCSSPRDKTLTNAARRYLFALAALAESHERSKGSHRLRSGCELVAVKKPEFQLRGAQPPEDQAAEVKSLYFDRGRLIALARSSMATLSIPASHPDFVVTKETLSGEIVSANAATKEAERVAAKEGKITEKAAKKAAKDAKKAGGL